MLAGASLTLGGLVNLTAAPQTWSSEHHFWVPPLASFLVSLSEPVFSKTPETFFLLFQMEGAYSASGRPSTLVLHSNLFPKQI